MEWAEQTHGEGWALPSAGLPAGVPLPGTGEQGQGFPSPPLWQDGYSACWHCPQLHCLSPALAGGQHPARCPPASPSCGVSSPHAASPAPTFSWCCGSRHPPGWAARKSGEALARLLGSAAAWPPQHPPRTQGLVPQDPAPLAQPHPNPTEKPRQAPMAPGAAGSGSRPLPLQQGDCFPSLGAEHKPEDKLLGAGALLLARVHHPAPARESPRGATQAKPKHLPLPKEAGLTAGENRDTGWAQEGQALGSS